MALKMSIDTRRGFLTKGLGLVGVGGGLPLFLVRTAMGGARPTRDETILVVLQLSGGNDGLSSVVPIDDDDYGRVRTTTRIAAGDVLRIDGRFGLHRNLAGLRDLFEQGAMAVVQSVGYPNPNLSHFQSMDIWHAADALGRRRGSGWLGRAADRVLKGRYDPSFTVAVGSGAAPPAIAGDSHRGLCFQQPDNYRFVGGRRDRMNQDVYRQMQQSPAADGNLELQFVSRVVSNANASSEQVRTLASKYASAVSYPTTPLGKSLQTVAALIAGGLSTRVYYVSHGGYDTHAGQRGRHDNLMSQLNDAISAFQKDLAAQQDADRVLTVAFSEFGRRVQENASGGTDHGMAGPMFLFGPRAKPGLHGTPLDLKELDRGNLRFGVDFRSVYAAVLEKHLGVNAAPVLGREFPPLDCIA